MRRLMMVLAAMLLLTVAALAQEIPESDISTPREGFAVVAPQDAGGMAPLCADPAGTDVLMSYLAGTPVTVLDVGENGMAHVKIGEDVGEQSVWLEGYMRSELLRYGVRAARTVPRSTFSFSTPWEIDLLKAPQEGAQAVWRLNWEESVFAAGISPEGWLHVLWPLGGRHDIGGFMCSEGIDLGEAQTWSAWAVPPIAGERTEAEIRERAIQETITHAQELGLDAGEAHYDALDAMVFDIRLTYDSVTDEATWMVWIDREMKADTNVSTCLFDAQGNLLRIEHSNG